ncbi:MAG: acetyltransferase [Geobacter sp.]
MSLPVLVLGGGGHAKVLIDALLSASTVIAGIIDPDPLLAGARVLGVPVLGGDAIVTKFPAGEVLLVNGLGSVGPPLRRKQLFEQFKEQDYRFATVIHPSAIIACDAELGEGVQIMAGTIIQPGCRIGTNTIINTKASVDHDCIIGDHAHIAPGVTLSGGVLVGNASHIGTSATVIQSIKIGESSIVGAGAVVVKDVTAGTTVVGVAAKEIQR